MSKMNDLPQVLDDLISCGEKIIRTANAIRECLTADDAPAGVPAEKGAEAPEAAAPSYSKEDIRELLAAKAAEAGGRFKPQVKAIVKKYGNGGKLADIPAGSDPALVEELEGLADA